MDSEDLKKAVQKRLVWEDQKIRVPVRFAGAQIPICMDLPTNVETIKEAIDYAVDVKADYLVTPEAALSGYLREFCDTPEDQHHLMIAERQVIEYASSKNIGLCLGTLWMESEDAGQLKRNQMRYYDKSGTFVGAYNKIQTIRNDNVVPGIFNEPMQGNKHHQGPVTDAGHYTARLSNSKGQFEVSTLICNDMYGEDLYGRTVARRALYALKNRDNPIELVLHPTFGFRGYEVCDALIKPQNDGMDPRADKVKAFFEAWHKAHLEVLSFSTKSTFLIVDTCSNMQGEMSEHPTSSPSGVIEDGEWLTDVPRIGKQYFHYDFYLPGKNVQTTQNFDDLGSMLANNPKPLEQ